MELLPFQGTAFALSGEGMDAITRGLGLHPAEVWAVLAVETSGCGFLADRRPQILFERHVFHRLTGGQYDDGDISDPLPGEYGPAGSHQYERLLKAVAKDRIAALGSTSWGIGQILGQNYGAAGFADVEGMVAAMSVSEDQQIAAMAAFLKSSRLEVALGAHDWRSFARQYNGRSYSANHYDARLSGEFQRLSQGNLPDLNVRAVQLYLIYLGFDPGPVDGIAGTKTLSALSEFQLRHSIEPTRQITESTVAVLSDAVASA
jgi:N-acetylmuramidase/Putative peptidoglycan binding domain